MRAHLFAYMGGGTPPLDPTTLALTGWWRAGDYNGTTTWTGAASAGSSGSRNLTAHGPPTSGSALNGHAPVDFVGASSQYLDNALAISNFVSASAWSAWALVNMTSEPANFSDPSAYLNAGVVADSGGYWGMYVSSGGFAGDERVEGFDYPAGKEAHFTNGSWAFFQVRYGGSVIETRVNSGAWQTAIVADVLNLSSSLLVGKSNGSSFITGSVAEIALTNSRLDDATFDGVKSYANFRYALSL